MHCNYPDGAGAVLVIELDGAASRGRAGVRRGRAAVPRERRLRAAAGHRPRRPGADLEGPQVRVRGGRPDQPRLHRPGRRHPAHRAARGAPRDRRAVRHRPGSGWPTSSTPATATCTRWCSSTTRSRAPARPPRRSAARSSTSASSTAARSPASTASAWTRRSTCRGCTPTTTSTRCSWCAAPSTRRTSPTPARCSRRRGCAGRCPVGKKGAHPLQEAGLAEVF